MIGIATYDSTIQFYNLKLTLQEVYWNLILVAGYVYLLLFVLPYVHELQLCALVFVGGRGGEGTDRDFTFHLVYDSNMPTLSHYKCYCIFVKPCK